MQLNWDLITVEALTSVDLDSLIENVEERECSAYASELSKVERIEGRCSPAQAECLRFAGHIVAMMLQAGDLTEPFGPMFVVRGRRSALPADFPKDKLMELEPWMMALSDPEIKARFLDVLWLQTKSFAAARSAVNSYVASAMRLDTPHAWLGCFERMERAVRLVSQLGKGGSDLKATVLSEVELLAKKNRSEDTSYFCLKLVRLLLEFRHGKLDELARLTLASADAARATNDFMRAHDYLTLAAECFRAAKDRDAATLATQQAAECLVFEAERALGQPGRGAMAAASVLADAIQALRQVQGTRERVAELHDRLVAVQAQVAAEFTTHSTSFDGTQLVQLALDAVRGKSFRDAVVALCNLIRPPSVEKLIDEAHVTARTSVLGSLFSNTVVNSRGRVVARVPPFEGAGHDVNDPALRWVLFQIARTGRGVFVQAMLNPATDEISAVHAPSRQDILDLIRYSPWIPPGHAEGIARALLAGLHGDMLVAAHMVFPQLEALVRHAVESNGAVTSMLDPTSIQQERPLSQLLDTVEANQAFGGDAVFELQDLLIDPLGSNLRNELAHGLMVDGAMFDSEAVYAWGLLLKFCVLSSSFVEGRVNSEN